MEETSVATSVETEIIPHEVIGLSLSACVLAIAQGEVRIEEVKRIITGTKIPKDGWDEAIKAYQKSKWEDFPDKCESICRQLLKEGKIHQPRLDDPPRRVDRFNHDKGHRIWVESEVEVDYY